MRKTSFYTKMQKAQSKLSLGLKFCAVILVAVIAMGLGRFELTQHFCANQLMEQSFSTQAIKSCCPISSNAETRLQKASCCSIQTQVFELPQAFVSNIISIDTEKAPMISELSFRLLASDLKNHNNDVFKIPLQLHSVPSWILWGAFLS
jgi:hypothetical protein